MVQMKEQIKAPEKLQLSNEEIANLSDAEFKTLVIRTSGQDGGIGRHTVPPHTTKRRTTTIKKQKNNQN